MDNRITKRGRVSNMEVKKPKKTAKQFWSSFTKQVAVLAIFSQTAFIGLAVVLLKDTNTIDLQDIMFWIKVAILLSVGILLNSLLIIYVARPLRNTVAALMHISGEKTTLKPPNPNSQENVATGFSDVLQTIYELSTKDSSEDSDKPVKVTDNDILKTLDATVCGLIAMDSDKNIIYNNHAAPVHVNPDGKKVMDLIFVGEDSFENWLKDCDENSVNAEKMWTRIPDRLPNQEGRRLFDIIATYNKGARPETVLSLIDRTNKYSVDEESLDFIAFAAHELRGPITVIRGYLDVLNDELSDVFKNDQQELFRRLIVSANRLSGYVNNILNTSRYDRRHLKVHLVKDTLANVYSMISDDMDLRAKLQNRLMTVDIPTDLPAIAVDPASMSEVLCNLIDNAIKYSNEGGAINVIAKTQGEFVEVSVIDHGIGMPESVVKNLFQKFYRSHRSRETVAGTGIGLYISKAIIESHGGTINVQSEDGHGSTFTVSIPIYDTVASKLQASDNSNEGLIKEGNGWIKNHSMYRG